VYLTDVLGGIILRSDGDPIDDLLPYNWADSQAAILPSIAAQAA
jgi:transposase